MKQNGVSHTMEEIQTQKEVRTQATSWMNPEDGILSEISKTQKDKSLCDFTHMRHRAVRSRNTEETGGDRNEESVLKECRVSACSVNGWRLHSHVNAPNAQSCPRKDGRGLPQ